MGPPRPLILYHKPTSRCDCRCRFCDFWKHQAKEDDCLPAADVLDLIDNAGRAGMTFYTVWGGEPLLVESLPDFLDRARKNNMTSTVCTSGYRLKDRAREIAPLTDQLLLSLEAVGEKQDKLRGTPGLYKRLTEGLAEYKEHCSGEIILWSNLTRENADQVGPIARFAEEHGIGVEYFPAALYEGYNEDIVLDSNERDEVFREAMELKRQGLPVYNTMYALELMRSGRPFKCNLARLAVQVAPDGTMYPCEPRVIADPEPYGHISEVDLKDLPSLPVYARNVERLASCNACLLPCVANMSDSLFMQGARRLFNRVYYR